MKRGFKSQVHPGVAAIFVIAALVVANYLWWKGLVWQRPQTPPGNGGPGPMNLSNIIRLSGREDVTVETLAGDLTPGTQDGSPYSAKFDRPTGIAIDAEGGLLVADTGNHRIRRIAPDGNTVTIAGGESGYADGPCETAQFNAPCGVTAAPDGAYYVADTGNNAIRRIRDGQVSTLIGGPRDAGKLSVPTSVTYAPGPVLRVADAGHRLLGTYGMDGKLKSAAPMTGAPIAVAATGKPSTAIPQTGLLMLEGQGSNNVPIEGRTEPSLALRKPVALTPIGSDWLAADAVHAALFVVSSGSARVLAGSANSVGSLRGYRDADGLKSTFGAIGGIAVDKSGRIYVSDTPNNVIRRVLAPEYFSGAPVRRQGSAPTGNITAPGSGPGRMPGMEGLP